MHYVHSGQIPFIVKLYSKGLGVFGSNVAEFRGRGDAKYYCPKCCVKEALKAT